MSTSRLSEGLASNSPFPAEGKSSVVQRAGFLARFSCLGASCEDTCCKGWDMQVDDATHERYAASAPELLAAVGEGSSGRIMRRNETGACVKLEGGLCGIQAKHGESLLGDACHLYPRITRALGGINIMTATLSCPETARLMLSEAQGFAYESDVPMNRVPQSLKDYLPEGMDAEQALRVHRAFLDAAGDETASPQRIMARLVSVAQSLSYLSVPAWEEALAFYLRQANARLPMAETNPADPFNVLHMLCGITVAAQKKSQARLMQTLGEMERALRMQLDWEQVQITLSPESEAAAQIVMAQWQANLAAHFAPLLRRWLQAQLSMTLFPFAGLGHSLAQRSLLLAMRFAVVQLALACACADQKKIIDEASAIRVVQSLSRLLDHLAEPDLMLAICESAGWGREPRLRALILDNAAQYQ